MGESWATDLDLEFIDSEWVAGLRSGVEGNGSDWLLSRRAFLGVEGGVGVGVGVVPVVDASSNGHVRSGSCKVSLIGSYPLIVLCKDMLAIFCLRLFLFDFKLLPWSLWLLHVCFHLFVLWIIVSGAGSTCPLHRQYCAEGSLSASRHRMPLPVN